MAMVVRPPEPHIPCSSKPLIGLSTRTLYVLVLLLLWSLLTITTYKQVNRHHAMSTDAHWINQQLLDDYKQQSQRSKKPSKNRTTIPGGAHTNNHHSNKTISAKSSKQNDPDFANNHNNTRCDVVYSYDDIKRCYPSNKRKNMTSYKSSCDSITTWSDVQHCLNGRYPRPTIDKKQNKSFWPRDYKKTIHLVGERNSGTKWVVDEMKNCFPRDKYHFKIERDLFGRNKHFFQITDRWKTQQDHVVIAIFRDPVEWVAAMIEKPYHMTEHMNGFDEQGTPIPLDWKEFVSKPWTMKNRSKYDFRLLEMKKKDPHEYLPCRSGLQFHEVVPCRFDPGTIPQHLVRSHNPVYELKRGGTKDEPYQTILELRSDKIVNMVLEVPLLQDLSGFLAIRFEDLLLNGTRGMLEQVADLVGIVGGLPSDCKPQQPRPEFIGRRKIPDGLRQWVEDHLILRTERLLGYR